MKQCLLLFLVFCGCTSSGGHWQHYRISAFDEARTRGMSIYLHFFQAGNTICEKQKSVLEDIVKDKKFKKVGAYRVAMGTEKALEAAFHISTPCAVVVLDGATEKGRVVGETNRDILEILLKRAADLEK